MILSRPEKGGATSYSTHSKIDARTIRTSVQSDMLSPHRSESHWRQNITRDTDHWTRSEVSANVAFVSESPSKPSLFFLRPPSFAWTALYVTYQDRSSIDRSVNKKQRLFGFTKLQLNNCWDLTRTDSRLETSVLGGNSDICIAFGDQCGGLDVVYIKHRFNIISISINVNISIIIIIHLQNVIDNPYTEGDTNS